MRKINRWAENPRLQAAIENLQDVMDAENAAGNLEANYWSLFIDSPEGVYETGGGCDDPRHKLHVSQAASTTLMNALVEDAKADRTDSPDLRGHVH